MKKVNVNQKFNKSFTSNMYANYACCLIVENARMEGKTAEAFEKGVIEMAKTFNRTMNAFILKSEDSKAFDLASDGMADFWDHFLEEYRQKEGEIDFRKKNDKFYFQFGFALMTRWYENIKDNKKKVA